MDVCPDYEDLFKIFNSHGIKFLLIGGQAVIYYTEPRYTKDVDIWILQEQNNAATIYKALKAFGAPLKGISAEDFLNKNLIIQIGVAPVRIDLLLNIEGVKAAMAWKNRKRVLYGKTPIHVMSAKDLIVVKNKAGRPQDLLDVEKLKKLKPKKKKRSP